MLRAVGVQVQQPAGVGDLQAAQHRHGLCSLLPLLVCARKALGVCVCVRAYVCAYVCVACVYDTCVCVCMCGYMYIVYANTYVCKSIRTRMYIGVVVAVHGPLGAER